MKLLFIFLSIGALLTGCASMQSTGKKQAILVRSEPSGAQITADGENLGTTPGFVLLKRGKASEFQLKYGNLPAETHQVPTTYDWGGSFFANFVWLTAAPLGWITDWYTEADWKMHNPPVIALKGAKAGSKYHLIPKTLAVVPPETEEIYLTHKVGRQIEEHLRAENPKLKVLSYNDTLPIFQKHNSDFGLAEQERDRNALFYDLEADQVFVSEVISDKDSHKVRGYYLTPLTGEEKGPVEWDITEHFEKNQNKYVFKRFNWLPNTAFLNLSSNHTDVKIDNNTYQTDNISETGVDKLFKYLSTVSLTYLNRPRSNVSPHFEWNFVPSVYFSSKSMSLPNYFLTEDAKFKRFQSTIGYGVEGRYMLRYGFFYADFIPAAAWTRMKYQSLVGNGTIEKTSMQIIFELGYTHFISEHAVFRLFTRSVTENEDVWEQAVKNIDPTVQNVTSATTVIAGISLGYYFPTSIKRR